MEKQIGKCALCGKECKLSFEHIPPKAAFNAAPAKPIPMGTLLNNLDRDPNEFKKLPYKNQQKGMGLPSLCESCNSLTGTWYGEAYRVFAEKGNYLAQAYDDSAYQGVEFKGIYPLRIIKQVLSMFCSVNPNVAMDDIRKFVLNKSDIGLNRSRYRICMYFTRSGIKRYIGFHAVANIVDGTCTTQSEITAYPFGFILYFDPVDVQKYKGIDITSFAESKYDDFCNVKLPIIFHKVNTWLPLDYRTKSELQIDNLDTNE